MDQSVDKYNAVTWYRYFLIFSKNLNSKADKYVYYTGKNVLPYNIAL